MDVDILSTGAVPDKMVPSGLAIQRAIDKVHDMGGGRVIVPSGSFLSESLILKDNVELHLENGAVLMGSLRRDELKMFPKDETVSGYDEIESFDGGFFIGAYHAKNIKISGAGVIYGRGNLLFDDENEDPNEECPKFTKPTRPRMLMFEDVQGLVIKDVTLKDAAFWTVHMCGCRDVKITGIRIVNDDRGVNTDGIDPDCCKNVIISDCNIFTGDDAISIKSTKPMAKIYGDCENILINNCILHSRSSAVKIGTETYGTIRNVNISNCTVDGCSRGLGVWMRDGGIIENIQFHHITGSVRKYQPALYLSDKPGWWGKGEAVFINTTERVVRSGHYGNDDIEFFDSAEDIKERDLGTIRHISVDHLNMKCESSIFIAGEAEDIIRDVKMSDVSLTFTQTGTQQGGEFDEMPSKRGIYDHSIPAVYARYVDGLSIYGSSVCAEGKPTAWNGEIIETEESENVSYEIKILS